MHGITLLGVLLAATSPSLAGSGMYPYVDAKAMSDKDTTKVLFIGNSFTYFWDMPGLLMNLSASAQPPHKLYAAHVTGGGLTLEDHWKSGKAMEAIGKYDWDVIVLQRWREPGKDKDLETYVPLFAQAIHKDRPKAKILIYMTESTSVTFGAPTSQPVPAVDLPKLQQAYAAAAAKAKATLVPASWAWMRAMREKAPAEQWFWKTNDGHPSVRRQYLTACMMYAAIYESSPVGLSLRQISVMAKDANPFVAPAQTETLSEADARYMQQIAWEAVRDHSGNPRLSAGLAATTTAPTSQPTTTSASSPTAPRSSR